ncbi:MAG: sterol desaturase family protein [Myxococcales bacterium]|nr:sterol desaturase family protein [Myxococcales bacterium]
MSPRSLARATAERLAYPAIVAASAGVVLAALAAGLPVIVAMGAANAVAIAAVCVLERWLPYRDAWRRDHGDVGTDLRHLIFSSLGAQAIAQPLLLLAALGGIRLSRALGTGLWPVDLPLGLQLALALLLAELGYYWLHRLYHQTGLWRLHGVHHSAARLYWLNSSRNHPGDYLLAILVVLGPLALLGAGERITALVTVVSFAIMLLQHSNIAMKLGGWNAVFVGGETHRWHHSRESAEQHRNYGSVLMIWDVVFGTFYLPRDREPPVDVGLTEVADFPRGYLGQIWAPFQSVWWRRP